MQQNAHQIIHDVKTTIVTAFDNFNTWSAPEQRSNGFWTGKLNAAMEALGERLNLDVRASSKGPDRCEFLYDVVFLETVVPKRVVDGYFAPGASLKNVPLVLESEWLPNPEEVIYDFSKLLVARADLRILVFWSRKESERSAILERVTGAIRDFRAGDPKDRYLICAIDSTGQAKFTLLDGTGSECEVERRA